MLPRSYIVVWASVFALIAACSSSLYAGWVLVQNNPITIYRDTRTGLEWSVTLDSAEHDHDYARQLVAQYGLRLPTWDELRDVVNNNDAIDWLDIEDGLFDLYETSDPIDTAVAWRGKIKTRRYRKWFNRHGNVGVRKAADTEGRALSNDSNTALPSSENNEQTTEDKLGKLYVLNVWGTNASDLHDSLEELQHRFGFAMKAGGLNLKSESDPDKFVKEFVSLSGDKASKKNVLETCRAIGKRAQKNDVIFVYMCCHGVMRNINGDNKRYHVLFPGIKTVDQMQNIEEYGILRSDILEALNPEKHRLTVFITDAGAKEQDEQIITRPGDPNIVVCYDPGYLMRSPAEENLLRIFLRTNTGLVDWNSTSPFGGKDGKGEQSPIYRIAQEHEGLFFSSMMGLTIGVEDEDKESVSTSELFNELKDRLTKHYESITELDDFFNNDIKKSNLIFTNQSSQTLFDFKGLGYVIDNEKNETDADNGADSKQ